MGEVLTKVFGCIMVVAWVVIAFFASIGLAIWSIFFCAEQILRVMV